MAAAKRKPANARRFPVKNILIALAIALITVFFVAYATQAFYPSPVYDKYCPSQAVVPMNETGCIAVNGTWQPYEKPIDNGASGYCDTYSKCSQAYNDVRQVYERNIFFVNIIAGVVIVVLSFLLAFETVSNGFLGAGILLLIYGSIRYWGQLSNVLRTIVLGVVLVILVWIAYKKLKN